MGHSRCLLDIALLTYFFFSFTVSFLLPCDAFGHSQDRCIALQCLFQQANQPRQKIIAQEKVLVPESPQRALGMVRW